FTTMGAFVFQKLTRVREFSGLVLVKDQSLVDLLALCIRSASGKCQALAILADRSPGLLDDFAALLHCGPGAVRTGSRHRDGVGIGIARHGMVLAVILGAEARVDRLTLRVDSIDGLLHI